MFLRLFLVFWVVLLSTLAAPFVFNLSPLLVPLYWVLCVTGGYAAGKQINY